MTVMDSNRLAASDQPTVRRLPARRLPVTRSRARQAASGALEVLCPLVKSSVLLERCAFCMHGHGLLIDPVNDWLTLQCSYHQQAPNAQQGSSRT